MGKIRALQGATTSYFHVVPSEISRVTVSPERRAIDGYLEQVGSDQFVEFISDILVQAEGHTLIDVTDGPGDEKQDILSLDRGGQRHLTQCKHTSDSERNANGDDLDLLLAACLRKNCQSATFVTNGDLTPQAKRYVTDGEYSRGWKGHVDSLPAVDYWNGSRIWKRIARRSEILNKWFGGMAQAHGLRKFYGDFVIHKMPDADGADLEAEYFASELKRARGIPSVLKERSFTLTLEDGLRVNLSNWFRTQYDLGIHFPLGQERALPVDAPLGAIRVECSIPPTVESFQPEVYRDQVAKLLGGVLPPLDTKHWWHVVFTAASAFVFAQDIAKPILATVAGLETYVKVGTADLSSERTWGVVPGSDFVDASDPNDPNDATWEHPATGTRLSVFGEQRISPLEAYELGFRQRQFVANAKGYVFRKSPRVSAWGQDVVRRLMNPEWPIFQASSGEIFWTYPPDIEQRTVDRLENVLRRRGIKVVEVDDIEKHMVLERLREAPADLEGAILCSGNGLRPPISLESRVFWFAREVEMRKELSAQKQLDLLRLKAEYEADHGYDLLHGKKRRRIAGEEVKRLLFDPFTFRGSHMLEVAFVGRGIALQMRFRERRTESAAILAARYLEEFKRVEEQVIDVLTCEA
jgi:hypothetical protein